MQHRVSVGVAFLVVVLVLVSVLTARADGGVGMGIIKPFTGGTGWQTVNFSFNWSIKLTAEPSFGVWADGIFVPESGNAQAGVGLCGNLGEGARRINWHLSDEFQNVLDNAYVGGAILTDKFDFNDWSHWSGGFYGKYTLVTF